MMPSLIGRLSPEVGPPLQQAICVWAEALPLSDGVDDTLVLARLARGWPPARPSVRTASAASTLGIADTIG
jgi:hypothetical protein